jgi:hypothetical protein
MSGIIMEAEDIIAHYRAEAGSLREELVRERTAREAAERAQDLAIAEGLKWQRQYAEARKQLQAWADEADKEMKLAELRRKEVEAYEL